MNKNNETLGSKLITLHPDKIPVIIYHDNITFFKNGFKESSNTGVRNLVVQKNITVNQLLVILRCNIKILHTETLRLYVNNYMLKDNDIIEYIYDKYRNLKDGCLYITIVKENMFKAIHNL